MIGKKSPNFWKKQPKQLPSQEMSNYLHRNLISMKFQIIYIKLLLKSKSPNFWKKQPKQLPSQEMSNYLHRNLISMKVLIIYIKPLWKSKNSYSKPCFETASLGENVKFCQSKKQPKMLTILGHLHLFQKSQLPNGLKITKSGHPGEKDPVNFQVIQCV